MPVRADPPDEQLRLDGARAVHYDHPAGVLRAGRQARDRPGLAAGPAAERAGQRRVQVDPGEVAHDHRGRVRRPYPRLVESAHPGCVDPRHGLLGAAAWPGQSHGRREQLLRQLLRRAPARIGQLEPYAVEAVAYQPLDLAVRDVGDRSASATSPSALRNRETGTSSETRTPR